MKNKFKKLALVALNVLLLLLFLFALGEEEELTALCGVNTSDGFEYLTNGDIRDYWECPWQDACITIELPENAECGSLVVDWYKAPYEYTISQFAKDGTLLTRENCDNEFEYLVTYTALDAQTARVRIDVSEGTTISNVHIYAPGAQAAQNWQSPVEKADIMLIITHQDDEELWFGGTIPYYACARKNAMQVVYMVNCGRLRKQEALCGLWAMGVTTYPVFLDLADGYLSALLWGGNDNVMGLICDLLKKYRPEVVVTHDINGEYGHPQHILTSRFVLAAVKKSAEDGTWQVKKLYRHLGSENVIKMDWETPLDELGGKSPIELANLGFSFHKSQQGTWNMEKGKLYDNSLFSLVYTVVGSDVYKDDFLENTVCDPRFCAAQ